MSDNYNSSHVKNFDQSNSLNFVSLKHVPVYQSSGGTLNLHNFHACNSHEVSNETSSNKLLPRIEGIITDTGTYDHSSRECKELYSYIDGNRHPNNSEFAVDNRTANNADYKNVPECSTEHFDSRTSTDRHASFSHINLNWEKPKTSNSGESSDGNAGTSYNIDSHVIEQHFGFKGEQDMDIINTPERSDDTGCDLSDVSCDVSVSSIREPEIVFREKDLHENEDTDSASSAESSSGINPYNDEERSRLIKCNECELYVKSKGNLKVHMRIHAGIYPYVCKECGEAFPSCSLYHRHKVKHNPVKKSYVCSECDKMLNCEKHYKVHRRKHLAPKMFDCFECKQSFATKDRLIRHSKIHFGDLSYFCEKCGQIYPNKPKFDEHKLTHSSNNWKCEECNNCSFESSEELEKHILSVHDTQNTTDDVMQPIQLPANKENKRFGCEVCPMKFEKISDYYIHRCNHQTDRPYKCEFCSASFVKEFHLFVHSAGHKIQSYSCDNCKAKFQSKKTLKVHKQSHCHNLPFGCCHCDLSYDSAELLNSHMKTHCGEKPFSCDQCEATFRHSSTLKMHQRIHTGDKPFICSVCGASFIQSHHLQIHLRSHSNNKPYKCNECEASFTKKDYLFAHRTKHVNEGVNVIDGTENNSFGSEVGSFRCTYCEMVFSHQSTLSAHIRKHTGERPFVCDKCGASFLYSSNLTTHRRKHTGERPYKCKECDASFTLKSYLTMHLRKHSGERPFKCDVCEASFTQKTHLSTHKRIHTGEYPYKCEYCGDAFRDGANFWRHKKRHTDSLHQKDSGNRSTPGGSMRPRNKKLKTKSHIDGKTIPITPSFISPQYIGEKEKNLNENNQLSAIIEDNHCEKDCNVTVKTESLG